MYYLNSKTPQILFQETRNNKIYVDKSQLIGLVSQHIRTGNKYLCITRPRRFGKTVNVNMLGAYYTKGMDSDALFDHLAVADTMGYREHLNRHNVIYIDFSRQPDICLSYEDYIRSILGNLKQDLSEAYPALQPDKYDSLSKMFLDTKDSFIFLMDEWDSVFREDFMGDREKAHFLKFLKLLLKDQPYVELAYMTGVLPIAKYSSGSELNMFDEFSFMNDNIFDSCFGFVEEEVRSLCKTQSSFAYEELKAWYDGYRTSSGDSLFNPRSVTRAITQGVCRNYWTETGPMHEVADCVEHNAGAVREDIVKLVAGVPVEAKLNGYSVSELRMDTRDEILSAMVVYGFLSYHDGVLEIPNRELMEKFEGVLARDSMGAVKAIVEQSREMLQATLSCDEVRTAEILEEIHDREIPFLSYGDENSLSCVITLCYLAARDRYWIEREVKSGKGYCDYLFIPKKKGDPAIVLELKVGRSCEEAIAQIKERNYIQKVKNCKEILLVGINYDKEKRHSCRIERVDI